jgi:zinc/manganese transport system ATP-binding protein
LLVSHDVNLIAKYAHRVMYIANGQYALGTVNQVLQSAVLTRLYGTEVEVLNIASKIIVLTSATNSSGTSVGLHNRCNQEVVGNVLL